MKYLIIFGLPWLLYRFGVVRRFLNLLKVPDSTDPTPPPKMTEAPPIPERIRLEETCKYILQMQDYEHPETVAYMSDAMLNQIISNYLKKS